MNFLDSDFYLLFAFIIIIIEFYTIHRILMVIEKKLSKKGPLSEMMSEVLLIFSLLGVLTILFESVMALLSGSTEYEKYRLMATYAIFLNPYAAFLFCKIPF